MRRRRLPAARSLEEYQAAESLHHAIISDERVRFVPERPKRYALFGVAASFIWCMFVLTLLRAQRQQQLNADDTHDGLPPSIMQRLDNRSGAMEFAIFLSVAGCVILPALGYSTGKLLDIKYRSAAEEKVYRQLNKPTTNENILNGAHRIRLLSLDDFRVFASYLLRHNAPLYAYVLLCRMQHDDADLKFSDSEADDENVIMHDNPLVERQAPDSKAAEIDEAKTTLAPVVEPAAAVVTLTEQAKFLHENRDYQILAPQARARLWKIWLEQMSRPHLAEWIQHYFLYPFHCPSGKTKFFLQQDCDLFDCLNAVERKIIQIHLPIQQLTDTQFNFLLQFLLNLPQSKWYVELLIKKIADSGEAVDEGFLRTHFLALRQQTHYQELTPRDRAHLWKSWQAQIRAYRGLNFKKFLNAYFYSVFDLAPELRASELQRDFSAFTACAKQEIILYKNFLAIEVLDGEQWAILSDCLLKNNLDDYAWTVVKRMKNLAPAANFMIAQHIDFLRQHPVHQRLRYEQRTRLVAFWLKNQINDFLLSYLTYSLDHTALPDVEKLADAESRVLANLSLEHQLTLQQLFSEATAPITLLAGYCFLRDRRLAQMAAIDESPEDAAIIQDQLVQLANAGDIAKVAKREHLIEAYLTSTPDDLPRRSIHLKLLLQATAHELAAYPEKFAICEEYSLDYAMRRNQEKLFELFAFGLCVRHLVTGDSLSRLRDQPERVQQLWGMIFYALTAPLVQNAHVVSSFAWCCLELFQVDRTRHVDEKSSLTDARDVAQLLITELYKVTQALPSNPGMFDNDEFDIGYISARLGLYAFEQFINHPSKEWLLYFAVYTIDSKLILIDDWSSIPPASLAILERILQLSQQPKAQGNNNALKRFLKALPGDAFSMNRVPVLKALLELASQQNDSQAVYQLVAKAEKDFRHLLVDDRNFKMDQWLNFSLNQIQIDTRSETYIAICRNLTRYAADAKPEDSGIDDCRSSEEMLLYLADCNDSRLPRLMAENVFPIAQREPAALIKFFGAAKQYYGIETKCANLKNLLCVSIRINLQNKPAEMNTLFDKVRQAYEAVFPRSPRVGQSGLFPPAGDESSDDENYRLVH